MLSEPQQRVIDHGVRGLAHPVTLLYYTPDVPSTATAAERALLEAIAAASDRVHLEVLAEQWDAAREERVRIARTPAIVVNGAEDHGTRYTGRPTATSSKRSSPSSGRYRGTLRAQRGVPRGGARARRSLAPGSPGRAHVTRLHDRRVAVARLAIESPRISVDVVNIAVLPFWPSATVSTTSRPRSPTARRPVRCSPRGGLRPRGSPPADGRCLMGSPAVRARWA